MASEVTDTEQEAEVGMAPNYSTIRYEVLDHVAYVTLNRPERLNALDEVMHKELTDVWMQINQDDDVTVAVVTGEGRAFCTGADVREPAEAQSGGRVGPERWEKGGDWIYQFGVTGKERYMRRGMPQPTHGMPGKPLIAAINGMCAGGGLHFVAQADFAIAADDASFFDPHVNVCVVPMHETFVMTRTIPRPIATAIAFTGKYWRVDAQRAFELGLVTEVVPREELMDRAKELADLIVAHSSPMAMFGAKANMWGSFNLPYEEAKKWKHVYLNQVRFFSDDAKEGPRAFAEKRPPNWAKPELKVPWIDAKRGE